MAAGDELWSFSTRLYSRPAVRSACLHLQDDCDADVCVILMLLWIAEEERSVAVPDLRLLLQSSAPWRERVVQPLREVRRRLKDGPAIVAPDERIELRESLAAVELEAERLHCGLLQELVRAVASRPSPPRRHAALESLHAYQQILQAEFPQQAIDSLVGDA